VDLYEFLPPGWVFGCRSIAEGNGKTALTLLKGLLSGQLVKVRSDDPAELADEAPEMRHLGGNFSP
jgi:hypothetical protein